MTHNNNNNANFINIIKTFFEEYDSAAINSFSCRTALEIINETIDTIIENGVISNATFEDLDNNLKFYINAFNKIMIEEFFDLLSKAKKNIIQKYYFDIETIMKKLQVIGWKYFNDHLNNQLITSENAGDIYLCNFIKMLLHSEMPIGEVTYGILNSNNLLQLVNTKNITKRDGELYYQTSYVNGF